MFILELCDREGVTLEEGDIVKISDGHRFKFYAEVRYLADKEYVSPFHTFSFHSFIKVDRIPDDAIECLNEGDDYKIWYVETPEHDLKAKDYEDYLIGWRACEHLINRCYKIKEQTDEK